MTEIEQKALALVNEVRAEHGGHPNGIIAKNTYAWDALCRAIEQHEAFRREVSEAAIKCFGASFTGHPLNRFIIPQPQPDPLAEALSDIGTIDPNGAAKDFRAALAARGLKIVKKEPSQ